MAKHKDHGEGGVNLGIIITPMLDMAFQLLAFFVMTYHPSGFEGHYSVRQTLPPEKKIGSAGAKTEPKKSDELPGNEEPKLVEAVLLIVKAAPAKSDFRQEGEPEQILFKNPTNPTPEIIANKEDLLDSKTGGGEFMNKLGRQLHKIKETSGIEADIKLEPDPDLRHEWVMNIMGVCRKEGFHKISLVEPAKR